MQLLQNFDSFLLSKMASENLNILPYDGVANYYQSVFTEEESIALMEKLSKTIVWRNDESKLFGKHYITKRKVAWYGDKAFEYRYSNINRYALTWTNELLFIKDRIENFTSESFNSCLLNLYHDGSEGMGWHSDNESTLQKNATIASLSLGANRRFCFKHKKTNEKKEIILNNGSIILMKEEIQDNWLHQLPKMLKIKNPRINLTFRMFDDR